MDNIYENICDTPRQGAFDLRATFSDLPRILQQLLQLGIVLCSCSTCGCSCPLCQSIAQFFALSRALSKQPRATWSRLVCVQAAPAACMPNDVPGIYYRFASPMPCKHNIINAYGDRAA